LGFGATANNYSNDPAAHSAQQNQGDLDNSPSNLIVLPECLWAAAYGGGTWITEIQLADMTGGSTVVAYFSYGNGNRRGPFTIWTNSGGAGRSVLFNNFLSFLGTIDTGFNYYGRIGAVEFLTQDSSHKIQVAARIRNGNYSKTFPGLRMANGTTADTSRSMLILDLISNSSYRSSCGFFNISPDPVTVEFRLVNGQGNTVGSIFTKTFVGYDYKTFNPFVEAGVPYPSNSFDNIVLLVRPISGAGRIVSFGASANNSSNDPASHLSLRY